MKYKNSKVFFLFGEYVVFMYISPLLRQLKPTDTTLYFRLLTLKNIQGGEIKILFTINVNFSNWNRGMWQFAIDLGITVPFDWNSTTLIV